MTHPFVRSKPPSLRPDLPIGRAPRASVVQDAAPRHRRSRREASLTTRARRYNQTQGTPSTAPPLAGLPPRRFLLTMGGRSSPLEGEVGNAAALPGGGGCRRSADVTIDAWPRRSRANLRRTPTDAEIRLWSWLRRKQLEGFRFRRQHPLGPYVVDFFCAAAKLIVEVDGGQHADDGDARTDWLEARGYRA